MWFYAPNAPVLGPQVVLNVQGHATLELSATIGHHTASIWLHELIIPVYAALLSVTILFLQLVYSACRRKGSNEDSPTIQTTLASRFQKHLDGMGGREIFTFRLLRLVSSVALVALSIYTIAAHKYTQDGRFATHLQFALLGVYVYLSGLALLSVSTASVFGRTIVRHLALVSFAAWSVFAYRDLWPLATFTLTPLDIGEGPLIWVKVGLLTLIGVVIPLVVPRQYVPFDPKDPAAIVNPEQTASIISMALYSFLDPYVFLGYRIPHLSLDQLPPLADYDYTKNLVTRSFSSIDPFLSGRKRHLFFGLMRVFWAEYIVLALMLILRVVTTLIVPIGMYRLLNYLSGNTDDIVRPWVWIVWMGVGPLLGSMSIQWYIFVATRMLVQVQALITQLVFEHALRIRVKAETSSTPSSSAASSVATTPDNASIAERSDGVESPVTDDETQTAVSEGTSATKASKRMSQAPSETSTAAVTDVASSSESKSGHLVGKLNNLVTTDLNNLVDGRDLLFIVVFAPAQITVCMLFLSKTLGWSAFVGLAVIILMFPIPGYIAKLIQETQVAKMKKSDARVQSVTEIMNVMRMIKLFGWEPRTSDQLAEKREEELVYQKRFKLLELLNGNINFLIPVLTSIVTYMTFTLVMKRQLTAALVFSSMAVFELLQENMHMIFGMLPMIIQAKVSLDRTHDFLQNTELLDKYTENAVEETETVVSPPDIDPQIIGIREAAFTWSGDNDGTLTPGKNNRNYVLRITDEVIFKRGSINLIVGPTGVGKTSILMALLGEMHYIPNGPNSYFQLPRAGGIAYAAQESWVQNETIRNNILFGAPYDKDRYEKVLYQCGLVRDLELFEAGDNTEVGEKGLTLSGGQKARVTLARAVYSSAEIILLDDVLAALDVHTSKWIVKNCFQGDLIRGRTVLLVTHNVHIAKPVADYVVSLGTDGRIASQGSLSKALSTDKKLAKEVDQEAKAVDKAEHTIDDPPEEDTKPAAPAESAEPKTKKDSDGKLIVAEEMSEGHVGWPALKLYFLSLSGGAPFGFWTFVICALLMTRAMQTLQAWYLGYWARQYETHDPSEVNPILYLSIYSGMTALEILFYVSGFILFVFGCLRASRTIHRDLIETVLGTTLRWLDKTPTSRIITRCTQDIQAVDGPISEYLGWLMDITMSMIIKFIAVIYIAPIFMIPGVFISILGAWCGQIYIKAQLSVKREMSNARAPVLGHFGAAVAGLTSIRAYGAEDAFKLELHKRIDRFSKAGRSFYNLNRWVCIRIESLAGLFAAGLAAYLVYGGSGVNASDTGFSLTMAVGFSGMILWWVRILNEFEIAGNSLERIQQYLVIEQEPKATKEGIPPAYWPASGELIVENLSAKYSENGPNVLDNISFKVNSGERIGIVGRTGSGKSSLTLALLRCILIEGKVIYDGLPTDSVNLDALRENITIIPQAPELLSGTLRQNLDPFGQHDDAVLNDALRAAGLFSLQAGDDESRITLDSQISSGGGNLSVGQRQILALARAIVRQSKILILDEATSAIDYETDTVIQNSLRQQLGKDVTLLTVAHRLQTIMDADKIMVLDAGHIVEFDKPSELLKIPDGKLKALVDESGEKERLYAMANGEAV
ncbi:P-loop containing nucleoside triphosphate hydrolase protein [Irpex rosettiformis]|uniref:P-loop containing nucleoside triphosphate hydrolase protein n=1 Tax=Irpex rosettiformis TaxID=378272 RepID=A0ACB8TUF6_9APHY|nr:P-loop containing nucleoside triphosphate hydrolase protein [Irpex rosettiformis]